MVLADWQEASGTISYANSCVFVDSFPHESLVVTVVKVVSSYAMFFLRGFHTAYAGLLLRLNGAGSLTFLRLLGILKMHD